MKIINYSLCRLRKELDQGYNYNYNLSNFNYYNQDGILTIQPIMKPIYLYFYVYINSGKNTFYGLSQQSCGDRDLNSNLME